MVYVRENITEMEYASWFAAVKPLGVEEGALILGVRNKFVQTWFHEHYMDLLKDALRSLGAKNPQVHFEVLPAQQEAMLLPDDLSDDVKSRDILNGGENASHESIIQQEAHSSDGPLRKGKDRTHSEKEHSEKSSKKTKSQESQRKPQRQQQYQAPKGLNPKYTFDKFVIGPNNNLAHAAALRVAESLGKAYNPLFIYGDVGLGKTHLMHAVGHYLADRFPDKRIEYVSTESFTNDLINAIRDDKMVRFRSRYRNVDLLLVDDIQFLAGKERTQEEFFHTFNALYENNKQIILSSDRPPKDIQTLEGRLRSRFEWGLITDIQSPEFETRVAILKMNAENHSINIPQDILELIARQVTSNIRELEGALMRVVAYSSLNNMPFDKNVASKALSNVFAPQEKSIEMKDVVKIVAAHYKLTTEVICGSGRSRDVVLPRQIAQYLIRDLTDHSLPEIGQFFGRDHSTVMHAINKVAAKIKKDSELSEVVMSFKNQLQGVQESKS